MTTDAESPDHPMLINALAPWFGAKRNLAAAIVEELGPHAAFWEPFCGSLSVLFSKPNATMETVNDLHGDLVNLARVVKDSILSVKLYERLRRVLASRTLFEEAAARLKEFGPGTGERDVRGGWFPLIDRAADYFLVSWLGRNGVAGTATYTYGFSVRYTKNGGHSATRWVSAVESIPAWHERLRPVTILSEDGIGMLAKIEDAPGVVIYCDPPYLVKKAKYRHDFAEADHARLAEALRRFRRTRVVVSYYADPRLAELYPGWSVRRIEVTKSLVSATSRDSTNDAKAVEVLIVNGPLVGAPAASSSLF